MKLIFLTILLCSPMISCLELAHVIVNSNGSVVEINDTLNERLSYKLIEDEDLFNGILTIEDDDSPVAIMSIDPDGRMNCSIVNSL